MFSPVWVLSVALGKGLGGRGQIQGAGIESCPAHSSQPPELLSLAKFSFRTGDSTYRVSVKWTRKYSCSELMTMFRTTQPPLQC